MQLNGYATPLCAVRRGSVSRSAAAVYGFDSCRNGAPAAFATSTSAGLRLFAVTASAADNTMTFKQLLPAAREGGLIAALVMAGEGMVAAAATYSAHSAPAGGRLAGAMGSFTSSAAAPRSDGDSGAAAALEKAAAVALASVAAGVAAARADPGGVGNRADCDEKTLPLRPFPSRLPVLHPRCS